MIIQKQCDECRGYFLTALDRDKCSKCVNNARQRKLKSFGYPERMV